MLPVKRNAPNNQEDIATDRCHGLKRRKRNTSDSSHLRLTSPLRQQQHGRSFRKQQHQQQRQQPPHDGQSRGCSINNVSANATGHIHNVGNNIDRFLDSQMVISNNKGAYFLLMQHDTALAVNCLRVAVETVEERMRRHSAAAATSVPAVERNGSTAEAGSNSNNNNNNTPQTDSPTREEVADESSSRADADDNGAVKAEDRSECNSINNADIDNKHKRTFSCMMSADPSSSSTPNSRRGEGHQHQQEQRQGQSQGQQRPAAGQSTPLPSGNDHDNPLDCGFWKRNSHINSNINGNANGSSNGSSSKAFIFENVIALMHYDATKIIPSAYLCTIAIIAHYNLALAYHMHGLRCNDRRSLSKALEHYEISYKYQMKKHITNDNANANDGGAPSRLLVRPQLAMSILNNIGTIHQHLGNAPQSTLFFQYLLSTMTLLQERTLSSSSSAEWKSTWDGFWWNVSQVVLKQGLTANAA